MSEPLRAAVRRYTEANADEFGIARTPISGMTLVRTTRVGELVYGIQRPLICLVVQGTKDVTMGSATLSFNAGDSLLITADVPTVSQITRASPVAPYLSFILDLDRALIADLTTEMKVGPAETTAPVRLQPTDAETADTALRLIRLLDRPASVPMLGAQLVREMHYWLLAGRHGPAIRHLGFPDGQANRIGKSVQLIRSRYEERLPVDQLAAVAGMSPSTFHHHFRAVTSLSPRQFQKQLRLIEARRLMLADSATPSNAAFAVGYESVPQFTRDYRRLFGLPPVRETDAARRKSKRPPGRGGLAKRATGHYTPRLRQGDEWGSMSVIKLIAGVLLATAGGSTCAMNSASTSQLDCTVTGAELLPPEIGGADALCDAIRAAAAEAGAPTAGGKVAVRVVSAYGAAATVTAPDGRSSPAIEVSSSDRPLSRGSITMLAREIARRLAPAR